MTHGLSREEQQTALTRLLRESEAIAAQSKAALVSASPSSHADGAPPGHGAAAARLAAFLATLLQRLPAAVTRDARCDALTAALRALPPAAAPQQLLAAALTALETVVAALASFAGALRLLQGYRTSLRLSRCRPLRRAC